MQQLVIGRLKLEISGSKDCSFRFACNRCPAVITAYEGAKKMKLKESECEECGAREVAVTLKVCGGGGIRWPSVVGRICFFIPRAHIVRIR